MCTCAHALSIQKRHYSANINTLTSQVQRHSNRTESGGGDDIPNHCLHHGDGGGGGDRHQTHPHGGLLLHGDLLRVASFLYTVEFNDTTAMTLICGAILRNLTSHDPTCNGARPGISEKCVSI